MRTQIIYRIGITHRPQQVDKLLYYANFFDNTMEEIILEWIESINDN